MNEHPKTSLVLAICGVIFVLLSVAFRLEIWGKPELPPEGSTIDPAFTNTASIRQSVAQLLKAGADPSDYDCYICHERESPPKITVDTNNMIVLPDEHSDLVMLHGRYNRNANCYNCHDPQNLDRLKISGGQLVPFAESIKLCASCHGPIYRDWEMGVHGRRNGFWDKSLGEMVPLHCTSCHDPHAPQFKAVEPAPMPHLPHGAGNHHGQAGLEGPGHDGEETGGRDEPDEAGEGEGDEDQPVPDEGHGGDEVKAGTEKAVKEKGEN